MRESHANPKLATEAHFQEESPSKSWIQGHCHHASLVGSRSHRPELGPHPPAFRGAALYLAQPGPQPCLGPTALLAAIPHWTPVGGPHYAVRPSLPCRCWPHGLESGSEVVFRLPHPALTHMRTVRDPTGRGAVCSDPRVGDEEPQRAGDRSGSREPCVHEGAWPDSDPIPKPVPPQTTHYDLREQLLTSTLSWLPRPSGPL